MIYFCVTGYYLRKKCRGGGTWFYPLETDWIMKNNKSTVMSEADQDIFWLKIMKTNIINKKNIIQMIHSHKAQEHISKKAVNQYKVF